MRRIEIALAIFAICAASEAGAFDSVRCDNDNNPTPSFASGRDSAGCLLLNPGNGSASVRFDFEAHDVVNPQLPGANHPTAKKCDTNDCGLVVWNTIFDDFQNPTTGVSGGDVLQWSGRDYQYMLFKSGGMGNTFKCKGGSWSGPNGLSCSPGEVSSGHNDALQIRGQPVNDGWMVFQDWKIVNAADIHVILEMCGDGEYVGPPPGSVWQGMMVGYEPGFGAATNWTADCKAMGDDVCGVPAAGSARWQVASNCSEETFKTVWLIDSWSHVRVQADRTKELVIVNTGCDNVNGCDGTIGFENGWPAPLGHAMSNKGPGVCPNGKLAGDVRSDGGDTAVPAYCYTSIEKALAAGHKRPPFLQLSNAGWENPPNVSDNQAPAAPVLLP